MNAADVALQNEDSLLRHATVAHPKAWLSTAIGVSASTFLFALRGPMVGGLWLAALILVYTVRYIFQAKIIKGEAWVRPIYPFIIFADGMLYVSLALLLWQVSGGASRLIALVSLFSVALYASVGTHHDRKIMLCLMGPSLAALMVLLTSMAWHIASPVVATIITFIVPLTIASFIINGLALNRADREHIRTNAQLQRLTREQATDHQFLEQVSAIAEIGSWRFLPEARQLIWSGASQRIHGMPDDFQPTVEEGLGFVGEDYRQMLADQFDRAATTGGSLDARLQVRRADGRDIWVQAVGRSYQPPGEPMELIGALRDITEQVETEHRLAELAHQAQAASQSKDAFLANMSHEIRTPLNGVVGLAAAMLDTSLDGRQREMVGLIHSSSETLERLLSDLLDLSKIEAGRMDLQPEVFDLETSVETAAFVMRARAEAKALDFVISYGEGATGAFLGDAVRIRQIISNLASNAVKFTANGKVVVNVGVEPDGDNPQGARLVVAVRDTGIGFDNETAQRLFQRFEQADGSITRSYGGTGLGLSISQALAEGMGGEITAWSEPGIGSTFTLRLPLLRIDAPVASRDPQGVTSAAPPSGAEPVRLLLAEDNLVNQRAMSLMLEPFGVDLQIAGNGLEAVHAFEHQSFDLVLMDMQMPQMDGLAATREIRQLEAARGLPRTPVVMVSANALRAHVQQALDAGCDLHLSKPVTPASLMQALQQALELGGAADRTPSVAAKAT